MKSFDNISQRECVLSQSICIAVVLEHRPTWQVNVEAIGQRADKSEVHQATDSYIICAIIYVTWLWRYLYVRRRKSRQKLSEGLCLNVMLVFRFLACSNSTFKSINPPPPPQTGSYIVVRNDLMKNRLVILHNSWWVIWGLRYEFNTVPVIYTSLSNVIQWAFIHCLESCFLPFKDSAV